MYSSQDKRGIEGGSNTQAQNDKFLDYSDLLNVVSHSISELFLSVFLMCLFVLPLLEYNNRQQVTCKFHSRWHASANRPSQSFSLVQLQ